MCLGRRDSVCLGEARVGGERTNCHRHFERHRGNQLGLGRQARGQKPTVKWSRTKATAPLDRRRNPVSMTYK